VILAARGRDRRHSSVQRARLCSAEFLF
jgi:hypothetical protein